MKGNLSIKKYFMKICKWSNYEEVLGAVKYVGFFSIPEKQEPSQDDDCLEVIPNWK